MSTSADETLQPGSGCKNVAFGLRKKKRLQLEWAAQSQVTAALKLLMTVMSPGKLALPEWLQSTTQLSH